jgi:hypothetical protein
MTDAYYEIAPNEEYGVAKNMFDRSQLREFSFRLDKPGQVQTWPDMRWQLPSNDRPDVVWALRQVRLLSPLVRQVFTELAGPRDAIQWIPAQLLDRAGDVFEYWVPHFFVHQDVLHDRHTNYGPSGLPIRWVLDRQKLDGLGVFVVPGLSAHYLIHERVGRALAAAGATGYTSQRARSAE